MIQKLQPRTAGQSPLNETCACEQGICVIGYPKENGVVYLLSIYKSYKKRRYEYLITLLQKFLLRRFFQKTLACLEYHSAKPRVSNLRLRSRMRLFDHSVVALCDYEKINGNLPVCAYLLKFYSCCSERFN